MNLQFNEEVLHPRTAEQHPAKKKGIKEFFSPDFGIVHTHTHHQINPLQHNTQYAFKLYQNYIQCDCHSYISLSMIFVEFIQKTKKKTLHFVSNDLDM